MKKFLITLITVFFLAGTFFTQTSASASRPVINESCDIIYTVLPGDTISKIAEKCGLSVMEILSYNPQIAISSLIYRGQVIRLSESADYSITNYSSLYWLYYYYYNQGDFYTNPYNDPTSAYGNAVVTVSTTVAEPGDSIIVKYSGFPANTDVDLQVGKKGHDYVSVYDGRTDEDGKGKNTITIPSTADDGERWLIYVFTTDRRYPVGSYSPIVYINSDGTNNEDDEVMITLSTQKAAPGDTIEVYVSGFPAKQDIDYRLGKKDKKYTVAYDGFTNKKGEDTITITIPDTAVAGETWIVFVKTADRSVVVSGYSPDITITE